MRREAEERHTNIDEWTTRVIVAETNKLFISKSWFPEESRIKMDLDCAQCKK